VLRRTLLAGLGSIAAAPAAFACAVATHFEPKTGQYPLLVVARAAKVEGVGDNGWLAKLLQSGGLFGESGWKIRFQILRRVKGRVPETQVDYFQSTEDPCLSLPDLKEGGLYGVFMSRPSRALVVHGFTSLEEAQHHEPAFRTRSS